MSLGNPPKALFTDVFGTVVDWRTTVIKLLDTSALAALQSNTKSIPSNTRQAATKLSWPSFAEEWRQAYFKFTNSFDPDTTPFKPIDQHHLESLQELVQTHGIQDLWTFEELKQISLVWHSLDPWPDSAPGLRSLTNSGFKLSTLSNGGTTLLKDLATHGSLSYSYFLGAEDFKAYKPHPKVYTGACEIVGVPVDQCAMIPAHMSDLAAAKSNGMQVIYLEREGEEFMDLAYIRKAREEGWVDMWIGIGEGGFEEISRRLATAGAR